MQYLNCFAFPNFGVDNLSNRYSSPFKLGKCVVPEFQKGLPCRSLEHVTPTANYIKDARIWGILSHLLVNFTSSLFCWSDLQVPTSSKPTEWLWDVNRSLKARLNLSWFWLRLNIRQWHFSSVALAPVCPNLFAAIRTES